MFFLFSALESVHHLVHLRNQSFTNCFTNISPYRNGEDEEDGYARKVCVCVCVCVCGGGYIEVYILINIQWPLWTGNFCSQSAIQKWKWKCLSAGSQMRGCQLFMGDCFTVVRQDMPGGKRCNSVTPLIYMQHTSVVFCSGLISIAELHLFWPLGRICLSWCRGNEGMSTYWPVSVERRRLLISWSTSRLKLN